MSIKLLIFDFDGTLADTKKMYLELTYRFVKQRGYKITKKDIIPFIGTALRDLLPIFGIKKKDGKTIIGKINDYLIRHVNAAKPCPGIKIIEKLAKKYRLAVVSNSHQLFIEEFLRKHKLRKYFSDVWGFQQFRKSKAEAFARLFKKYKIKPNEALYIGDRAKDVEIAREAGCSSAIVSNRFSWSKRKEILRQKPDFVVDSLRDLGKFQD